MNVGLWHPAAMSDPYAVVIVIGALFVLGCLLVVWEKYRT